MKIIKDIDFTQLAFDAESSWGKCLSAWLRQCYERSGSDHTLQHYQQIITDFFTAKPARTPDAYGRSDVESFIYEPVHACGREGRSPSPGTINNRLSAVSSYYTFAAAYTIADEQGIIKPVLRVPAPTLGMRRLKKVRTYHPLNASNVERLLSVIPKDTENGLKYRALVITFLFTARRSSEILELRFSDIERTILNEKGQQREVYTYSFFGKGMKRSRDTAELPQPAATAIFTYLEKSGRLKDIQPTDAVFTSDTTYEGRLGHDPKRPLSEQTVWSAVKRFARMADIDENLVNIHAFRHVSARERFAAGSSLREIQQLLRHSSIGTTDIYLREMVTVSDFGAKLIESRFGNL